MLTTVGAQGKPWLLFGLEVAVSRRERHAPEGISLQLRALLSFVEAEASCLRAPWGSAIASGAYPELR